MGQELTEILYSDTLNIALIHGHMNLLFKSVLSIEFVKVKPEIKYFNLLYVI